MINIAPIGRVTLPRGLSTKALEQVTIPLHRDVGQCRTDPEWLADVTQRTEQQLTSIAGLLGDSSVLGYRNVDTHDDDWGEVRFNRRWVAPGFLHVVIAGSATVTVGKKSVRVKRGDVFLMNPNVPHSVKARRKCVSVCYTVPLAQCFKVTRCQ